MAKYKLTLAKALPKIRKAWDDGTLQAKASLYNVKLRTSCRYRTITGGKKYGCVVGVCLPESIITKITVSGMNGQLIKEMEEGMHTSLEISKNDLRVLTKLQALHDAIALESGDDYAADIRRHKRTVKFLEALNKLEREIYA